MYQLRDIFHDLVLDSPKRMRVGSCNSYLARHYRLAKSYNYTLSEFELALEIDTNRDHRHLSHSRHQCNACFALSYLAVL